MKQATILEYQSDPTDQLTPLALVPKKYVDEKAGTLPMQLSVTSDGQTLINVFVLPTGKTVVEINGVRYHEDAYYDFQQSGGNTYLHWFNAFQLQTTDEIFFYK